MKQIPRLLIFPILALAFCANAPKFVAQTSAEIRFDVTNNSARLFVEDPGAKEGTEPNGAAHVAGVRAATEDDDGASNVMASDGSSLLVSLDKWRSAEGTAQITRTADGPDRVKVTFKHLIAFGAYSLFTADLADPDSSALRALDETGTGNTFEAKVDGTASMTVAADKHLTQGDAIVLIYHSDDIEHGAFPGKLFVDAHQQLIARL